MKKVFGCKGLKESCPRPVVLKNFAVDGVILLELWPERLRFSLMGDCPPDFQGTPMLPGQEMREQGKK